MSGGCGTTVLPTHTPALFDAAVRQAAALLRAGEVVAVPTETVYGLAANALEPAAVARLFEVKGRPAHNPIIVHVANVEMARSCAAAWPEPATRLAAAFWPGPLTIVLPRAAIIPEAVTAGGSTVGLRWPSHPFMQALIRACGFPLAAPSANPSNALSPTNADHVFRQLGGRIPLVVDGGQSQVGIESSVIDLAESPARVLRPGMVHVESLVAALGAPVLEGGLGKGTLRSPGQLPRHYAPQARLVVLPWAEEGELRARVAALGVDPGGCWIVAHSEVPSGAGWAGVSVIPHDAEAYARALYAELHRCDEGGVRTIVVQALPDEPAWRGLADRLRRASA